MPEGSPLWQGILFLCAAIFLLWEIWRGWRAGLIRKGIHLAALVIGSALGIAVAGVVAAPMGGLTNVAGFVAGLFIGGGAGIVSFLVICLMGAVLFKRTAQQSSGLLKFFWGVGGAFFGLLIGLVILWGSISVIKALGTMAEATIQARANQPKAPFPPAASPSPPPVLATQLVKLKESLELGPAGKFVDSVDSVPPDFYELLLEVSTLTRDPDAMLRLMDYPGIHEVVQNPRIVGLVNDPEIMRAAEQRDYLALMKNPKFVSVFEDPALAAQLEKIDLRAALKFALQKPAPTPAPAPAP